MQVILPIVILIISIMVHEVSHGYMADRLGDPTARLQGRLTLNPLSHIDPVGSIIVPLLTTMFGFTFGWAKPVPYNPYNLKNRRQGEFLIALAGPLSNIFIALIFGTILRLMDNGLQVASSVMVVFSYIVIINIVLAIFNLVPLPPLDGSKLLFSIFPKQYGQTRLMLERFSPMFILVFVFFLWQFISPVIPYIFRIFTGIGI